jgi:putative flippase GtrA
MKAIAALHSLLIRRSDNTAVHVLRSGIASFISFLVELSVLVSLTELLSVSWRISVVIAFASGMTLLYFLSIYWVFNKRRFSQASREFSIFFALALLSLAMNAGFFFMAAELLKASLYIREGFCLLSGVLYQFLPT